MQWRLQHIYTYCDVCVKEFSPQGCCKLEAPFRGVLHCCACAIETDKLALGAGVGEKWDLCQRHPGSGGGDLTPTFGWLEIYMHIASSVASWSIWTILIKLAIFLNYLSLCLQLLLTLLSFFWSALPIVLLGLYLLEGWALQTFLQHQLIESLQNRSATCKPTDIVPSSVCTPPTDLLLIFLGEELKKVAARVATAFSYAARTCIGAAGKRAIIAVVSVLHDWDDLRARCSPLVQELLLCTDNKH